MHPQHLNEIKIEETYSNRMRMEGGELPKPKGKVLGKMP
jgi:hypothetical protein